MRRVSCSCLNYWNKLLNCQSNSVTLQITPIKASVSLIKNPSNSYGVNGCNIIKTDMTVSSQGSSLKRTLIHIYIPQNIDLLNTRCTINGMSVPTVLSTIPPNKYYTKLSLYF